MARKLAKLTTTTGVLVGRRSSSGRPLNIRCNDRFYNGQAEEEEETCNRRMSLCGWSNIDTDGHDATLSLLVLPAGQELLVIGLWVGNWRVAKGNGEKIGELLKFDDFL